MFRCSSCLKKNLNIELSLKVIFELPLRATEGLLNSLVELMDVPLKVPDYTTLSRCQSKLEVELPSFIQNESRHVVVDSTGIKIIFKEPARTLITLMAAYALLLLPNTFFKWLERRAIRIASAKQKNSIRVPK